MPAHLPIQPLRQHTHAKQIRVPMHAATNTFHVSCPSLEPHRIHCHPINQPPTKPTHTLTPGCWPHTHRDSPSSTTSPRPSRPSNFKTLPSATHIRFNFQSTTHLVRQLHPMTSMSATTIQANGESLRMPTCCKQSQHLRVDATDMEE